MFSPRWSRHRSFMPGSSLPGGCITVSVTRAGSRSRPPSAQCDWPVVAWPAGYLVGDTVSGSAERYGCRKKREPKNIREALRTSPHRTGPSVRRLQRRTDRRLERRVVRYLAGCSAGQIHGHAAYADETADLPVSWPRFGPARAVCLPPAALPTAAGTTVPSGMADTGLPARWHVDLAGTEDDFVKARGH